MVTARIAEVLTAAVGERTRAEVGRAAGIERTMLSRMLDGKKAITLDEFVSICRALGLSPAEVVRAALLEGTRIDVIARRDAAKALGLDVPDRVNSPSVIEPLGRVGRRKRS